MPKFQPVVAIPAAADVSKHEASVSDLFKDSDVKALTWNITPQEPTESEKKYKDRLHRIAEKLARANVAEKNKLGIIALQGVPENLQQFFITEFETLTGQKNVWNSHFTKIKDNNGTLTLINTNKFDCKEGYQPPQFPSPFTRHILKLKKDDGTTIDKLVYFVNAYLVDGKLTSALADQNFVLAPEKADCQNIIAGDFHEASSKDVPNYRSAPNKNEGFVFKNRPEDYELTSVKIPVKPKQNFNPITAFTAAKSSTNPSLISHIVKDSDIQALTWNIHPLEKISAHEYNTRLTDVSQKLSDAIKTNKEIGIIALQGFPAGENEEDIVNALKLKELEAKGWIYTFNIKGKSTLITLVNTEHFEPVETDHANGFLNSKLKLKKAKVTTENTIRFVNAQFIKGQTLEPNKTSINEMYKGFEGQVIVAGNFSQKIDGVDCRITPTSANNGFIFRHDPETYSFNKPKLPIEVTGNFTSKIKIQTLIDTFSKPNISDITMSDGNSKAVINNLREKGEKVEIQRGAGDKISFKASNSSPTTLELLIQAAETCLVKGSKVQIAVSGDANDPAVKKIKNETWLGLVKKGLTSDYKPDEEFLKTRHADIPDEYKLRTTGPSQTS